MKRYVLQYLLHFAISSFFVHTVSLQIASGLKTVINDTTLPDSLIPEITISNDIETETQSAAGIEPKKRTTNSMESIKETDETTDLGNQITEIKEEPTRNPTRTTEFAMEYSKATESKNAFTDSKERNILITDFTKLYQNAESITLNNNVSETTTESRKLNTHNGNTTEDNEIIEFSETNRIPIGPNDKIEKPIEKVIAFFRFFENSSVSTTSTEQSTDTQSNDNDQTTSSTERLNQTKTPTYRIKNPQEDNKNIKYILQWTSGYNVPFDDSTHVGHNIFTAKNCSFTNCVITKRRFYLEDYTDFDAIVFFARDLMIYRRYTGMFMLPERRSQHQKYVFASFDYAHKYQASSSRFNGFFNWTWTFKLDSDLTWSHFVVRDVNGNIVAPSQNVQWMKPEDMLPVSEELRKNLFEKQKAVAWFDSCSSSLKKSYAYVWKLINLLETRHGVAVDKFGKCWQRDCHAKENSRICNEMLRKHYHFYISYEDTMREDYVTDNLLRAIDNNAVPIVFGGANYSRFLPDGSYINARSQSLCTVSDIINELLTDFNKYVEYFKWTNHYTFHRANESPETDPLCKVCKIMNDQEKVNKLQVYKNFTRWWGVSKPIRRKKPLYKIVDDNRPLTSHKNIIQPKKKILTPWTNFLKKTARFISGIYNSMVSDVKTFWNELTHKSGQYCSHKQINEYEK